MKQPKKLTRNQKEILVKKGMNPDDYMWIVNTFSDKFF